MEFLSRPDVKVRNWYRTHKSKDGPAMVHMKAWVVESNGLPVAALVGSANLTKNGLRANVEIMAEATGDDLTRTWGEVRGLHQKGWDRTDRLTEYIAAGLDVRPHRSESEDHTSEAEPTVVEASVAGESWKPDPTGRSQYRWWDGSKWTSYVASKERMSTDPMSKQDTENLKGATAGHIATTWANRIIERPPRDKRLAAFILECVLFFVTLFIGWAIWSLAAYGQGQTPAKQILNMRVVRIGDQTTASGWQMFLREIVLKSGFWFAFIITAPFFTLAPIFLGLACLWTMVGWAVSVRDPTGRTLWDKMLGTVVVTATAQN